MTVDDHFIKHGYANSGPDKRTAAQIETATTESRAADDADLQAGADNAAPLIGDIGAAILQSQAAQKRADEITALMRRRDGDDVPNPDLPERYRVSKAATERLRRYIELEELDQTARTQWAEEAAAKAAEQAELEKSAESLMAMTPEQRSEELKALAMASGAFPDSGFDDQDGA